MMRLSTDITTQHLQNSITDSVSNISNTLAMFGAYLASVSIGCDLEKISSSITNSLNNISNILINYQCNPEYIESYKKWGDFGWALCPNVSDSIFFEKPISLEASDMIMHKFCNDESIVQINNELLIKGVSDQDLKTAYNCYKNEQFKPCSMLLFSLIDCQLIDKKFKGVQDNGNMYTKTGLSAVLDLKKSYEGKCDDKGYLVFLKYKLIIHSLMALFKQVKDFENEPKVINRNCIMHGKSSRTVTSIDCYKLWSVLYSLVVVYPKLERNILND